MALNGTSIPRGERMIHHRGLIWAYNGKIVQPSPPPGGVALSPGPGVTKRLTSWPLQDTSEARVTSEAQFRLPWRLWAAVHHSAVPAVSAAIPDGDLFSQVTLNCQPSPRLQGSVAASQSCSEAYLGKHELQSCLRPALTEQPQASALTSLGLLPYLKNGEVIPFSQGLTSAQNEIRYVACPKPRRPAGTCLGSRGLVQGSTETTRIPHWHHQPGSPHATKLCSQIETHLIFVRFRCYLPNRVRRAHSNKIVFLLLSPHPSSVWHRALGWRPPSKHLRLTGFEPTQL